jgi:hypothetical protein
MKKLIAIFAVVLFAAPAFAADWSFYGSQRIATWYVDRDYGDGVVNGQDDDQATQWYFQGNSRLGAKVKADKVSGQIEFALGPSSTSNGDGGDTNVSTRLAFGVWNFSDNAWLRVGKSTSTLTDSISNQFFDADKNMYGVGEFYGRRPAGVTLGIGDFELAFLPTSYGTETGTSTGGINGATGGDADSYFPRLETSYKLKFNAGHIKPFAGVQYYTVESNGIGNITGDLDVWSWVVGVSTSWNIGAFSISGQVNYGMNEGSVTGWDAGPNARSSSQAYLKNGDDIANVYTLQALIVPALKLSDTLRFEAGFGFRQDNADGAPGYSQKDEVWVTYLQAMVTMAPGVFLCPEVGYYDYMDGVNGSDQGNRWYAGAKWQIDF